MPCREDEEELVSDAKHRVIARLGLKVSSIKLVAAAVEWLQGPRRSSAMP